MADLQSYRQQTAKLLGGYEGRGAVAASGARRTTAGSTTSRLVEARWPILRTRIESDLYEAAMLLRTGALTNPDDRSRQVGPEGYVPQEGAFVPDTDWVVAPAAGEEYEVHTHGFDPDQELTEFINGALRAIVLVVDVGFTLGIDEKGCYVPDVDVDGNALAGWLKLPSQVLQVRYGAYAGSMHAVNWDAWGYPVRGEAWLDGGRLYLAAGLIAAGCWVRALKPADWHCRPSPAAAYGEQRNLRAGVDSDESLPEPNWVATGAAALAWEASPETVEQGEAQLRARKIAEAKTAFYGHQSDYYTQALPDTTYTRLERLQ